MEDFIVVLSGESRSFLLGMGITGIGIILFLAFISWINNR